MAVSKVILNGNTLIDTTDKTVTNGSMLSGITALKNDGTTATGNIASKTSSDVTVSGDTVTVPAGNYASQVTKSVASGTAGTPTATKGTVSNHSVTVTPSVTNTTGYITGGTKSGTAVTVSASELDSGTKSITDNGTDIDVVGYAAVDVAVSAAAQYTAKITGNSTGTVEGYAKYNDVYYYSSGSEFTFSAGDTCKLDAEAIRTTASIYVDGVQVAFSDYGQAIYTYTLPSHSIEIYIQYDNVGRINITPLTLEITSNGEYDVTDYSVADVALPAGTEGTPVATKGTVSNHSISVTPSVTNTAGVITGGTHTGTAVTVSASELDSGTKSITDNGTGIDVVGYAAVDVAVPSTTVESLSVTQNGTYTAASGHAYSPVTVQVSGGGSTANNKVRFIDYDGTVLYEYTPAQFAELSALPANPSHTGLTAQGWNWTKQQITDQLTAIPNEDVNVGQMYITESGKTEIDVRFQDANFLSPYLMLAVNGEVSVDWGDGSSSDTVTGSSLTTNTFTQHVYSATGNYTIKITSVSGSYTFYQVSYNSVLVENTATSSNYNKTYATCVTAIRLGNGITSIATGAFQYCYSLTSLTIPSGVTSIGGNTFQYCYSLTSLTIPSGVTIIGGSAFQNCYSLTSLTIPSGVTSIGSSAFYTCYSLTSLTIPSGVTSIGSSAFQNCYSLTSLTIPSLVTSIGNSSLGNLYSMKEIHFQPTTPPTLGGTSVFNNLPSDCIIYVPYSADHSILTAYQTKTNYTGQASKMQEEPQS